MLLVLGLASLGAVVALGTVAQRYSAHLARRAEPGSSRAADPMREVERQVAAFVAVREELRRELDLGRGLGPEALRERLGRVLGRALDAEGLSRESFHALETMWRDWEQEGSAPSALYRGALARRRDHLRGLSLAPIDPREL